MMPFSKPTNYAERTKQHSDLTKFNTNVEKDESTDKFRFRETDIFQYSRKTETVHESKKRYYHEAAWIRLGSRDVLKSNIGDRKRNEWCNDFSWRG